MNGVYVNSTAIRRQQQIATPFFDYLVVQKRLELGEKTGGNIGGNKFVSGSSFKCLVRQSWLTQQGACPIHS